MSQIYEGMFLVDNQVVREDWRKAKGMVGDVLRKHGGTVQCLRRWDERRLTYPIRHKYRATYFLAFFELPNEGIEGLQRDLNLSEAVLRYLMTKADGVPEAERTLAAAEESPDFLVPEPPPDDKPAQEAVVILDDDDDDDGGHRRRRPREVELKDLDDEDDVVALGIDDESEEV